MLIYECSKALRKSIETIAQLSKFVLVSQIFLKFVAVRIYSLYHIGL